MGSMNCRRRRGKINAWPKSELWPKSESGLLWQMSVS